MDPPPEPPEEMQPAHKLILVQWTPFQASAFWNQKRINLRYFKSLSSWSFVTMTTGNQYPPLTYLFV